jgi:hypothetical protein
MMVVVNTVQKLWQYDRRQQLPNNSFNRRVVIIAGRSPMTFVISHLAHIFARNPALESIGLSDYHWAI